MLAGLLGKNRNLIEPHLYMGNVRWEGLVKRVGGSSAGWDEQLWTFLAACGYAIGGVEGVAGFTKIITGSDLPQPDYPRIWLEAMPMSPRKKEGNTRLDLALGTLRCRKGTRGGVELHDVSESWICFCEMKMYSDLSHEVTHDPHRNQLARVAENALCFQGRGRYADCVFVALVTPKIFECAPVKSRLYQYKFREYEAHRAHLQKDIDSCRMDPRHDSQDWSYPQDMADRIKRLELRWSTYEELFAKIPDSPISAGLKKFQEKHSAIP